MSQKKPSDKKIYLENEKDISDEALAMSKANELKLVADAKIAQAERVGGLLAARLNEGPGKTKLKRALWQCYVQEDFSKVRAEKVFLVKFLPYKVRCIVGKAKIREILDGFWKELRTELVLSGKYELLTNEAVEAILDAKKDAGLGEDPIARSYAKANVFQKITKFTKVDKGLINIYNNTSVDNRSVNITQKIGKTDDELKKIASDYGITIQQAKGILVSKAKQEKEKQEVIDVSETAS